MATRSTRCSIVSRVSRNGHIITVNHIIVEISLVQSTLRPLELGPIYKGATIY